MMWIDHDRTVREAIHTMVSNNIGSILVKKQDAIVGIWTERELLRSMNDADFNPDMDAVASSMSSQVPTAPSYTPLLKLKEMFLGLYTRHILVEKHGQYLGLLSIGDVLRASLLEQDRQIKELNATASWQYYENWGWNRKKQK